MVVFPAPHLWFLSGLLLQFFVLLVLDRLFRAIFQFFHRFVSQHHQFTGCIRFDVYKQVLGEGNTFCTYQQFMFRIILYSTEPFGITALLFVTHSFVTMTVLYVRQFLMVLYKYIDIPMLILCPHLAELNMLISMAAIYLSLLFLTSFFRPVCCHR